MQSNSDDVTDLQATEQNVLGKEAVHGPTVYYDGSCPLCSLEIRHYASQSGGDQLTYVDVSVEDPDLGTGLTRSNAMRRFHVRMPDGSLLSGASAFIEVWANLPRWAWLARLARLPGATHLLEAGYRAFLPLRPIISKVAGYFGARAATASTD